MTLAGGIDLGGSKIDARLFDAATDWALEDAHEIETPKQTYAALCQAIVEQVAWLRKKGASTVGLGAPGLIGTDGRALTANLPATGHKLSEDISAACKQPIPVINDCRAFALSEAMLGAGRGQETVMGLVIGTGLAAGFVHRGALILGVNGQAGEIGHQALPHSLIERHGLPVLQCGCGRTGCYETVASGTGMGRIAKMLTGRDVAARDLLSAMPEVSEHVVAIWADIIAELIFTSCVMIDPDMVVLGGGVSKLPGVADRLSSALQQRLLAGTRPPDIRVAEGGDRSGARGAAVYARLDTKGNVER